MTSINNLRWMAGAMESEAERPAQWKSDELATMLTHQLAAPIRADLEKLSADLSRRYDELVTPTTPQTFRELFASPNPPVNLLRLVKDFAKLAIADKNGPLPEEVGAALYYGSLACAQLRCGQRISGLDDATLNIGLNWALSQPWMEASLAALFRELQTRLAPSAPRT
jgi:hypothetical protein